MRDLKQRVVFASLARLTGQAMSMLINIGTLLILARILEPKDFGLVAMVTAITGAFQLIASGGLGSAAIREVEISAAQLSTLFWVNIGVGVLIAILCLMAGPLLVKYYGEPRLLGVSVALAVGFVITALGVQHATLLHRELNYSIMTKFDVAAQFGGALTGIALALGGAGYWALVAMTLMSASISTVSVWSYTRWVPDRPRWHAGSGTLLKFGGTLTLNTLAMYFAYNMDKVIVGRYLGAEALGLYGRAYQLINYGNTALYAAVAPVAFSALARLQTDRPRFKASFLKGYTLINSLTMPATVFCALHATDLVVVVLGSRWIAAAEVFRLLAPTVLVYGMINPLSWVLLSIGLQNRSLLIALVIAPIIILSYFVGFPHGITGIALAYAIAIGALAVPIIIWSIHGTGIGLREILSILARPACSSAVAGMVAVSVLYVAPANIAPIVRIVLGGVSMLATYALMLVLILGERTLYAEVRVALGQLLGSRTKR